MDAARETAANTIWRMAHNPGRSTKRTPPGYCDACSKPCCVAHQVGIRCYHCFEGVFVSYSYFYVVEYNGEEYAIPRPEVTEPAPGALAVNVTDPPAAELRERFWRWEHRFDVTPCASSASVHPDGGETSRETSAPIGARVIPL